LGLERHLTFRLVGDWRMSSSPQQHSSSASRFAQLAKALEYRNTSKRSDELLCMASILGLPTKGILGADSPDDRAIAFYKSLKTVPASILFCNGSRIAKYPFRWAVASFISAEDPRKLQTLARPTNHYGQVTPKGLLVRAQGMFFAFDDPYNVVHDFNRVWMKTDRISLEPVGWGKSSQMPPWQSWDTIKVARKTGDRLALIVNPACDHEGAVFKVLEDTNNIIHAEYLTQVHVRHAGKLPSADSDVPIWRQGLLAPSSSDDEDDASGMNDDDDDEHEAWGDSPWDDTILLSRRQEDQERRSITARRRGFRTNELQRWMIT
jgi:hypothetical protein